MFNRIFILASIYLVPVLLSAQLPAGRIAAYPLNNSAADVSGNAYDGTLSSTSNDLNRFGTANGATAFSSGTSTGTLPAALATALSNDFTVGYWLKTSMSAPTNVQWYSGAALVDAEVCGVTNDWGTALIDGGKIAMGIGNPDITIKSTLSTYNDGAWHFVTATRNKAAGVIILYVDGSQVATSSGTNTSALTAPTLIGLGRNPCAASGVFTGSLDDIIAYNRVLTAGEVTNLYNYYNAIPLPLNWKSFTGQVEAGQVYLHWETENSVNNDRFEIERSANGTDFSNIGELADNAGLQIAAGSSSYSFTDIKPLAGNDFYRIMQIDNDGRYSWSSVLSFRILRTFSGIRLFANPVTDEALLMNNGQLIIQRIQVREMTGRLISDQAPNSGNSTLKISTGSLRQGCYIVRVIAPGFETNIKMVKR